VKQVSIPDSNYVVELYLYDCAGQSIFNQLDMNSKYVRCSLVVLLVSLTCVCVQYDGAAAVVLVYSASSRESLQSTSKWLSGSFEYIC